MPPAFLRYDPSIEVPEENEAETTAQIVEVMRSISDTTFKDGGHGLRSAHAKSHGLLQGEMRVLDGLPPTLAQGVFAKPGTYPVVLRFSTSPGDILPDSVSTPRGLAVKILGVEGDRLPGSEGDAVQDFLLVDGPAFFAPSAKKFLGSISLLAKTTDSSEGLKKAFSALLRGVESVIEGVGGQSGTITSLGGHPETHILGATFYSQAPVRYGDYVAKLSVAPVSPALTALTDAPLDVNGVPNGLREAVTEFFSGQGGEWEVRIQLCTDLETMPVEDSTVVWPEDQSPYVAVARITAAAQPAWTETRSKVVDDCASFSPWHGITAHQPLGSIMRARKPSYAMSAAFRQSHNGCPIHGATDLAKLPA